MLGTIKETDLLSTEFNIYGWDFLSYEAIVVVVTYIYAKINHLTPDQVHRVRQWFWLSSFGERYKVGGENFVSNVLKIVYGYVVNSVGSAGDFGTPPSEKEWMGIAFRSNVSRSRAYMLALAARHPCNLTNGAYIDFTIALSSYNKKQFHHVYPRAHLRRSGNTVDGNLVINICMLSAAADNAISDADPITYLPNCAAMLGDRADVVFASNILPLPSTFDYSRVRYEDFLAARARLVTEYVGKLCAGNGA